jgi:hypothetical protein
MTNHRAPSSTTPRCTGCGVALRQDELTACTACTVGDDFLSVALAHQRANPRKKPAPGWRRRAR